MTLTIGTKAADTLSGSDGNDVVLGLRGNDLLIGHLGNDVLIGGSGDDTIGGDNIPVPGRPYGPDDFGPFYGEGSGETLPGNNLIIAGAGNDYIISGYGHNTVFGGSGNDTILGYGSYPTNLPARLDGEGSTLYGGAGNDFIEGGRSKDVLVGGTGNDTLVGNEFADTLTGGAGHDIFQFGRIEFVADTGVGPGNRDIITDFHHGQDQIDLTDYHNSITPNGQPNSVFLGTHGFEATFGLQVRYDIVGNHTVVQIDAPLGYGQVDDKPTVPARPTQEIELQGVHHLVASDFILPPGTGDYAVIA